MSATNNGWGEWSKYVLEAIKELNEEQKDITHKIEGNYKEIIEKIESMKTAVVEQVNKLDKKYVQLSTEVKLKSGIWGALGSLIPIITTITVLLLSGIIKIPG